MTANLLRLFAVIVCMGLFSVLNAQDRPCSPRPCAFQDVSLGAEARAADLVRRMTTEEKISQTMDHAKAVPRLGIAEYNWWNEGLHGVARNGFATVFPQAIAIASTWDAKLVQGVGDVVSTEARGKHDEAVKNNRFGRYSGLTYWSPNINIFRDPRWGRGQETYGEDPFLTATTGVAFIRGLQGDDPNYFKVIATPKHFAVHSGPEPSRHGFDVDPSPYDLEDTYIPAFRAAIAEGHADSIMCAYNAVDHVPACANIMLLQTYLRDAWHFNGFVVSDCDAVDDVRRGHHYAPDDAHASAVSLKAGTDLDCGSAYNALGAALQGGLLTESSLNEALVRLFTARIRLGMFDPPDRVPYSKLSAANVDTPANRRLALQVARESVVLLENKRHILPLATKKRIAVVGPTADLLQAVEGNYQGTASQPVLPLEGMRKQFGAENVVYSPGATLAESMAMPIPSTAFHQSQDGSAPGLKAEYYTGPDLSGKLALTRVDDLINFNWDSVVPDPAVPGHNFSVRWTGYLTFPVAGKYTLHFRGIPRPKDVPDMTGEGKQAASDSKVAVRIFLDDRLVLDSRTGQSAFDLSAAAPGPRAIRVEYNRVSNDRYVSLEWTPPAGALLKDAVQAAKSADVVVAFVGLSPDLEGEQMSVHVPGFDGGDRTEIDLPLSQEQLLQEMKATGKPLIVVLTSGSAVAMNWAQANADAMLEAWYGGEEAGTAIAETIAGSNNPSGRLPVTFYRNVKDLPHFDDYSMANRTYRYFKGKPLYRFGFGLSYSSFAYGKPVLSSSEIPAGDAVELKTNVTNVSGVEGDEVVEVYVDAPGGQAGAHPFLAGYMRVHLKATESKVVAIAIRPAQLSRVNAHGERSIAPGKYRLFAGGGQPVLDGHESFAALVVTGSVTLPK
jgi:beta-glucosidase